MILVELDGYRVREHLAALRSAAGGEGDLECGVVRSIAETIGTQFDPRHGGFADSERPKFPNGVAIRLALAHSFLAGDDGLRRSALETLDAYARSGMRDHVNGGFFRYSTNRALTVPHFEKMDYVQSARLQAYLDAYRLTGDSLYAAVARDIMRYVDSTLSDRERGGFYAHQDADVSLDDDGSYYTWSLADLEAALPPDEAETLRFHYDVQEDGERREDALQNVLRIARTVEDVADDLDLSAEEASRRIRRGTQRLETARADQKAPFVETTKFTDRNAMMVSTYLDAYETLGDTAARDFALTTLGLLLESAVQSDGTVLHATAEGDSYIDGFMADYAGITDALLDAYQVTGEDRDLDTAERVMERAVTLFWDSAIGGFFDRPEDPDAPALLADRAKQYTDSPLPGDNAAASRIPRTGPANELVKQVLGLLMIAAGAFFIGTGVNSLLSGGQRSVYQWYWWLAAGIVVSACLWMVYRTFGLTPSRNRRVAFATIGVVLAGSSLALASEATRPSAIDWVFYTPQRLAHETSRGNVVLLDFTADWCINCKVLERTVLETRPVIDAAAASDVTPIKVDLTSDESPGWKLLTDYGRVGIPLLVILGPDGEEVFKADVYTPNQIRSIPASSSSNDRDGIRPMARLASRTVGLEPDRSANG